MKGGLPCRWRQEAKAEFFKGGIPPTLEEESSLERGGQTFKSLYLGQMAKENGIMGGGRCTNI